MIKRRSCLMILILLFFLAATMTLQACHQEDSHAEIQEEKLIGHIELPGSQGNHKEEGSHISAATSTSQSATHTADKPSAPEEIQTKLPDFSKYSNIKEKKKAFFDFLRPIVRAKNKKVLQERAYVLKKWQIFKQGHQLPDQDIKKLKSLAHTYRVNAEYTDGKEFFKDLLIHIDKIPVSLALVQAAKESGWGTSYFARKGNNLFGQWCFKKGCGIVPRKRPQGASYEVQAFENVGQSVRVYIQNLNSHPAYKKLRHERYQMRLAGKEPNAHLMARGLEKYSAMGKQYVETVRQMIQGNKKFMGIHESEAVSS